MLLKKLSLGKFKKSHFPQAHLFQTKIFEIHFSTHIWVQVDLRPVSQQIYKNSITSIRRKYVEGKERNFDQV